MTQGSTWWSSIKARVLSARRAGIIGSSLLVLATTAAFSQPDIVMRDCSGDNGDISGPGYPCGGSIYYSPDVWVRQNADWLPFDQPPIAGQDAYIYVHLHNRGNATSECGVLCLYYRDAGTYQTNWPSQWINFYYNGVLRADKVDKIDVCAMTPGEDRTVMLTWHNVPNNLDPGIHHCLLARYIASDDPMQTPETWDVLANISGNNNIVHRNCQQTIPGTPPIPIQVANATQENVKAQLKFDALDDKETGKNVFDVDGFAVKVTLDPELFAKWQDAGGEGKDLKVLADENAVVITSPHATLDNLPLPKADGDDYTSFTVNVEMQYPENIPDDAPNMLVWTMEQHNGGEAAAAAKAAGLPDPADGMAFEVYMHADGDNAAHKNTAPGTNVNSGKPEMTARPNVLKGNTSISYTLPQNAAVTLVIHDINGRAVRTLISKKETTSGSHEIEWDGKAADGSLVPAGTYFYRLTTPNGAVEQQLKIVR